MYICVLNLFLTFPGVTHRVNGTKPSVSGTAPHPSSTSPNVRVPACTALRACSRSASLTSVKSLPVLRDLASRMPLSSNVSRIAARR